MPAAVQLVCGDLFDGPADLVVLPCSTAGTVTQLVGDKLARFSLPEPMPIPLGEVRVLPLEDATHVAQFAAFAASVANYESTPAAIFQIAEILGQATQRSTAIRLVNAPLLGAGAGGLAPEVVAERLRQGFISQAAPDAVLNIYVLDRTVYRRVLAALGGDSAEEGSDTGRGLPEPRVRESTGVEQPESTAVQSGEAPLRVLISYTSNSSEQQQWVETLYRLLRENGVDARLDKFSLRLGGDVVQWMCNELQLADRVILVCDDRYAQRADGRHGGVGWETMLIQGDLFNAMYGGGSEPAQGKYIPIVRTPDLEEGRPRYLATKLALHWPPEAHAEERHRALLREIYNVQQEPPLGARPVRL
jgi:hypothetical protein